MEIQNESIFVSCLRGFCRSLFILLGAFVAIAIAVLGIAAIISPYQAEEKTSVTLLPDLNGKRDLVALNAPVILRINLHGIIGEEGLDTEAMEYILLDSRVKLLQNNRVKGIFLHCNTPGGTVVDSDNIYRLLKQYKQKFNVPIVAYIDGLCASGGMYITSAADAIYCSPTAIVGSIGVIYGPFFNVADAFDKIGVKARTLTEGLNKDMLNPTRPWKEGEDDALKKLMNHFYEQFVDVIVASHPRLDRVKLKEEYGAKVFDGDTAQELGYVDMANSDSNSALLSLLQKTNINPEEPYQIVELKPKKAFWSEMMRGDFSLLHGEMHHHLHLGNEKKPPFKDQFAYLYQPNG